MLTKLARIYWRNDCSLFSFLFQTEYKYCYDLVLHYVLHYLHKEDEYEEEWENQINPIKKSPEQKKEVQERKEEEKNCQKPMLHTREISEG